MHVMPRDVLHVPPAPKGHLLGRFGLAGLDGARAGIRGGKGEGAGGGIGGDGGGIGGDGGDGCSWGGEPSSVAQIEESSGWVHGVTEDGLDNNEKRRWLGK